MANKPAFLKLFNVAKGHFFRERLIVCEGRVEEVNRCLLMRLLGLEVLEEDKLVVGHAKRPFSVFEGQQKLATTFDYLFALRLFLGEQLVFEAADECLLISAYVLQRWLNRSALLNRPGLLLVVVDVRITRL